MSKQEENKLTVKCLKWLDSLISEGRPIYYEHRSGNGGFNYKKGIPDLFVVVNGTHIEIEFKTIDGHLSPMQEKYQYIFEKSHITCVCPRSLEEFQEAIKKWL